MRVPSLAFAGCSPVLARPVALYNPARLKVGLRQAVRRPARGHAQVLCAAAAPAQSSSVSSVEHVSVERARAAFLHRFASAVAGVSVPRALRAGIALLVSMGCGAMTPALVGLCINSLVNSAAGPGSAAAQVFFVGLIKLVIVFVSECVAMLVYVRNMNALIDGAVLKLKTDTLKSVTGVDASFFDKEGSSHVADALTTDCRQVRQLLWGSLRRDRGARALADSILGMSIVFMISRRLACVYLVLVPIMSTVCALTGLRVARLSNAEVAASSTAIGRTREALAEWKTVISFGAAEREVDGMEARLQSVDDGISSKLRQTKAADEFLGRFAICLVLCTFLGIGGALVSYGHVPLKSYLSTQPFLWSIIFGTQGIIYSVSDFAQVRGLLKKIYSASDRAKASAAEIEVEGAGRLEKVRGHVELHNVSFSYPARPDVPVLDSFSLDIEAGKTTALVAKSGMGKSTVASLISRMYTPDEGFIFLDDVDVSSLDRAWYSEQVSTVSQQPILFSGTIGDAIAYGAPERRRPVSRRQVEQAAVLANAHEFINDLPDGYDTEVGERGTRLSGGQLQRIAIARALLRNSPVLVLDEATSALDADSEAKIQEALELLTAGRTVVVIAHRLSTIRDASKIVVLGTHGIIESGKFDDLMRLDGEFASLMRTQTTMFMTE